MRIGDILSRAAVLPSLDADNRDQAIRALTRALPIPQGCQEEVELSAFARERAGSTGIGGAIALPHGSCAHLKGPTLAMARMAQPVDFRAPDGKPVGVVFLLAVPQDHFYQHLYPLSTLSQLAGRSFASMIAEADNGDEIFGLLAPLPI